MPKTYDTAESVSAIAQGLLPNYHAELATARIMYVFVDTASSKGGREMPGKVRKFSGFLEWALERDFVVEIASDKWNDLTDRQRTALVDHLLECCTGEEDEKTGEMKWQVREPNVQEFETILQRHGAWNESLTGFISVAQSINLLAIVQDTTDIAESLLESVETQ